MAEFDRRFGCVWLPSCTIQVTPWWSPYRSTTHWALSSLQTWWCVWFTAPRGRGGDEVCAKFCTCVRIVSCRRKYVAKAHVETRVGISGFRDLYAICERSAAGRIVRADVAPGWPEDRRWRRSERAGQTETR